MALYHQLKFPSTFIEYRSVSECKGVVVISNFDSLEPPLQIYRPRQLPSLPRPKFAPAWLVLSFLSRSFQVGASFLVLCFRGFSPCVLVDFRGWGLLVLCSICWRLHRMFVMV